MEPEPKMEARPPALADAIVRALIPPACREAVIGDLWERYRSPAGLRLRGAARAPLPGFSRIRRTTNAPMVALAFLMLFASFGGRPRLWLNAVIPALAVLAAFSAPRRVSQDSSRPRHGARSAMGRRRGLRGGPTQAVARRRAARPAAARWGVLTGSRRAWPSRRTAGRPGSRTQRPSLAAGTAAVARRAARRDAAGGTGGTGNTPRGIRCRLLVIAAGIAGTVWSRRALRRRPASRSWPRAPAFVILYLHRHAMRPLPMDLDFDPTATAFRDCVGRGERLLRRVGSVPHTARDRAGSADRRVVRRAGTLVQKRRSLLAVLSMVSALPWTDEPDAANRIARRIEALDKTDERE